MGRTNPTFWDVLRSVEDRWKPFRRTLRHEDQERFDRLLEHAHTHADAAGNLNHQSPMVPILVAIAIGQERRIDELEQRLGDSDGKAPDRRDEPPG
ncbi:hypothetical protein [Halococcoides cellulosivorans]|uniref:DUF8156 domain-containing protein n=1 Tax=Halococcoides cellulosivorans TaxID=1679096 RepID=A0A2R4X4L4_9EURY|nr:hypothetical protein [Halococcoides cellulosivorans]AWB28736.1 hypothetical protein HARCEL1_12730 [Halococcoides cellulosivorans]